MINKTKISTGISFDEVRAKLRKDQADGTLSEKVTKAPFYYQSCIERPGYIEKVNSTTGQKITLKPNEKGSTIASRMPFTINNY